MASSTSWTDNALFYEYVSSVNPHLPDVPCLLYPSHLHQQGATRIIPFDLSEQLGCESPATSPNVSASYLRICSSESLSTEVNATAQLFYVIRGAGASETEYGRLSWSEGDVFTLPAVSSVTHRATADSALYWVNDAPLLTYLGVQPTRPKFKPALYTRDQIRAELEKIDHQPGARQRNRDAVISGNSEIKQVKSMTHTLWSAVVFVAPGEVQKPHRHNSVAVDIVITSQPGCYTQLGDRIDDNGDIINPQRVDWEAGAAFVTPPALWHAHFNESSQPAIVMAAQEAGFYENMRTLDIQFSHPSHQGTGREYKS
jgi:gentisate 1,2-dioxygenase